MKNNGYPTGPAPQKMGKSVLSRIRERFQEKPATKEEVAQLQLNAKREVAKTQIQRAKSSRGSRLDRFVGGGQSQGPSYRRSSRMAPQDNSFLFGGGQSQGGGFLDSSEGPSLSFITGVEPQRRGSRRKQESGFGQGLSDLF